MIGLTKNLTTTVTEASALQKRSFCNNEGVRLVFALQNEVNTKTKFL